MSSSTSIYTAPKSYHYTYWITNIKLQKHYIGVHTSKIPPIHDLGIKYFSSSSDKEFKKDQKSNPQDYEYKIIGLSHTREEASLNEIELHETYDVGKNPRFYNQCKATSTGFNRSGVEVAEKTKKKMSESHKNLPPFTEEHKKKISESGKNPSDKTRKKMSESAKNREPATEEARKSMSDAWKTRPADSQETKDKKSESAKNKPPDTEETKRKRSESAKNKPLDSQETKDKKSESAKNSWLRRRQLKT
jgi:hypothetical protein